MGIIQKNIDVTETKSQKKILFESETKREQHKNNG